MARDLGFEASGDRNSANGTLTILQERSLGYARDDDGAKRYQSSAALPYFYAPHHHFAFLISNFSFKRSFHPQSTGIPPKGLTLNPLLILFPQGSDHIPSSLPRSHQHLADENGVGTGLPHLFHDCL